MVRLVFWLSLGISCLAHAQNAIDLDESPTKGGLNIPGLEMSVRANSPTKYWVAVFNAQASPLLVDWRRPTHVIVTGHGGSAGTLFQNAAAARARKYAEVFPSHQVLLITVNELDGDTNAKKLESWGFEILFGRTSPLSVRLLLSELKNLRQIASFDLYAHANANSGAALDADFLSPHSSEVSHLRSQFMPQAWANIHGCNSGWFLSPALAGFWRLPVSGSFTGTHFQRLHSTQEFYPYDKELAPPGPFAALNPLSFNQVQNCTHAGCVRMHPDPYAYWGEWGRYTVGLGFYKFFCGPVAQVDCEARMAYSLLGFIGKTNLNLKSSRQEFMGVLKEFMCPINSASPVRQACEEGIETALRTHDDSYTPFLSQSLVCSATACHEPKEGQISQEFMKETKALIRGSQSILNH